MHQETLVILLALAGFGGLHSLAAAPEFKRRVQALMGERAYLGLYRLLYNGVSAITFLPVMALMEFNPGPALWAIKGLPVVLLLGIQAAALGGLTLAARHIEILRFAGLRQALAWWNGEPLPLPPEPLIQNGFYGWVRHPLYLFVIIFLWATPQMNASSLGFALGSSAYFMIGAWIEECRMVREFGAEYREYQRRVPWMIPWIHLPTPRCSPIDPARPPEH